MKLKTISNNSKQKVNVLRTMAQICKDKDKSVQQTMACISYKSNKDNKPIIKKKRKKPKKKKKTDY